MDDFEPRDIILGKGEVGKSLFDVLIDHYNLAIIDKGDDLECSCRILHVCFPYSEQFEANVEEYQVRFSPKVTVIHSTVPVGTSKRLGAVHSPIVGLHPNLADSIQTFTKFLGGPKAGEVADYFRRAGIKVYLTDKAETTELAKIMDTTMYGIEVEFVKELKSLCNKYELPFEFWNVYVNSYNKGYEDMGCSEYKKPNLIPIMKKQGGHCTIQNCELLPNPFTEFLKERNEKNEGFGGI